MITHTAWYVTKNESRDSEKFTRILSIFVFVYYSMILLICQDSFSPLIMRVRMSGLAICPMLILPCTKAKEIVFVASEPTSAPSARYFNPAGAEKSGCSAEDSPVLIFVGKLAESARQGVPQIPEMQEQRQKNRRGHFCSLRNSCLFLLRQPIGFVFCLIGDPLSQRFLYKTSSGSMPSFP